MLDIPIVFSSGLPRSGSTLLQNLLAQNPLYHCTGTNDLLDVIMRVRDSWMTLPGFIAQGLKVIEPRILSLLRGAIYGFYQPEFSAGKVVFDKCRGHLSNIELLETILARKIKVIVPVRDIRDIVSSFEKIYRKSAITDHPVQGAEVFRKLTIAGRAERLCSLDHTIGYVVNCLQDAFARGLGDRLVIVPYRELTHSPVATVKRVCLECNLPTFTCDPSHVEQVTQEDDTVYGMDLHTIRHKVEPDQGDSWRGILPVDLADLLDRQYADIQKLAKWEPKYIKREGR